MLQVASEDMLFKLDEYEKKVGKLSELLIEEELAYKSLLSERDQKIAQLEAMQGLSSAATPPSLLMLSPQTTAAVPPLSTSPSSSTPQTSSPVSQVLIPVAPSKVRVLEGRIVDMTIALEEKDKRIFELDAEIDKLKVELNQMRLEIGRIAELEEKLVQVEAEAAYELQTRISEYEATICELHAVIANLKGEIDVLSAQREEAVLEVINSPKNDIIQENEEIVLAADVIDNPIIEAEEEQDPVMLPHEEEIPPNVEDEEVVAPVEMDSLEVSPPENLNEPWLSMSAVCETLEELKHVGNSVAELENEPTPDNFYPPASPPSAKCTGCFTHLFKSSTRRTAAAAS